jgi:hypothetical protein
MDLLSHPFRLTPSGAVATVEDGTEEAYVEQVAVTAMTIKGERDLAPDFGVTDPTAAELDVDELNVTLADFEVPVTVAVTDTAYPSNTVQRVELALTIEE